VWVTATTHQPMSNFDAHRRPQRYASTIGVIAPVAVSAVSDRAKIIIEDPQPGPMIVILGDYW
jgi:hypothetical protein